MKKFIYILVCLASLGNLVAQESYKKPFYKKRRPGIMRFYTLNAPNEKSAEKFDRFNTDIYYNSWIGDMNGVKTKFYSIGHNLNFMFDIPFSKTSRFGIGIGFGYGHFNIRHDGLFNFIETTLGSNDSHTELSVYTGTDKWINRTAFNFIEIPFEFRIRARKERPKFKFYPGFKLGYLAGMYHKWRVNDKKYKEFNFPDQQKFHFGPTLRIGVSNIMLFGYYDLTMLFEDPKSPKLQLFSAGISISWF